jgi:transposase
MYHPHPPRKKTVCGTCGTVTRGWYDRRTRLVRDLPCGALRVFLAVDLRRVACRRCGGVRREGLAWLAKNPHYTQRFAFYVGHRCRSTPIREVATELGLDWHTVKALDKVYMEAQLAAAPPPAPAVIGIDEVSIRQGHVYRIVVSDLERHQPLWFGGVDRSEASMAMFYDFLGDAQTAQIRLAVMDMWPPFRAVTETRAPTAAILYDKFHILRHLQEALDHVRKAEYKRLTDRHARRYLKGQKYVLLAHWGNLSPEKQQGLAELFAVNTRLQKAYLLKEQFARLWDYRSATWARKFFTQWRAALRWQRLKPFEEFAALVERNWDGIVAYCDPANKVALGYVEGLNNKIRVIQRRCYGLRDEDYLHLKILTSTLPPLPIDKTGP